MGAERWCNQVGARAVALLYLSPEQGNFYHSVFTILFLPFCRRMLLMLRKEAWQELSAAKIRKNT